MQVALYARVSTSPQEKNETIESQLEILTASVEAQGYTLFSAHIFLDNGISGSRLDRPALDRLRDQVRLGECEVVILLSPDRLARSYPHQWVIQEKCRNMAVGLFSWKIPWGILRTDTC